MSDAPPQHVEEDVLNKIKELIERDDASIFDEDEVKVIREMMGVYTTILAFGRVGNWFKNILMGIAAMIGAYYAIHNWGASAIKAVFIAIVGVN